MNIYVLALDGVFDLGLSALLDGFQTANELIDMVGMSVPRFEVKVVGVRKTVRTAHGLTVPVRTVGRGRPDYVIVPAIACKTLPTLKAALARPDVRDTVKVLQKWASNGAILAAACAGTFVLAESGLLNQHRATTTWWLAPVFRERYPQVLLDESSMVVKSGKVVTAGAALGHMDLALWLIRTVSPELASLTARYLIVESRPSQTAYALTDHLVYSDPVVQAFERWARTRLARGFSLDRAAKAVGTSKRTLTRRLQTVLGKSPVAYIQSLRVERAVHLLKTSKASVEEIAAQVGYKDGGTLRVLLRRQLNLGLNEIRRSARRTA
jgi:transcriptional regulator GlxA family with amidase domain